MTAPQKTPELPAEVAGQSLRAVTGSALLRQLENHIAMMAPHQKERRGGILLIEAKDEIKRLREVMDDVLTFFPDDHAAKVAALKVPNDKLRHGGENQNV